MDTWQFAQDFFYKKCEELSIKDWTLTVNNAKRSMGMCVYSKKEVQLSSYLLKTNQDNTQNNLQKTQENIQETILHEIAHILAPGHSHDATWKAIAVSIGAIPKACCNYSVDIKYTYYLMCPNNCLKVGYHRKPKMDKQCRQCLSKLILIYAN